MCKLFLMLKTQKFIGRAGFTILEAVASILLISLILVSGFTILLNSRIQVIAQENRIIANQEIGLVRNRLINQITSLDDVELVSFVDWIVANSEENTLAINFADCEDIAQLEACNLFLGIEGEAIRFRDDIFITVRYEDDDVNNIYLFEITVDVNYYGERQLNNLTLLNVIAPGE